MYVVDNLRHQSADVDGIGRRKLKTMGIQPVFQRLVGKNTFYPCLGIVKISMDSHNKGIVPFLRNHLLFLNGADTVLGIKYDNTGAFHICKACQGRFACIPGSGCQYDNLVFYLILSGSCCHQMGQNGKRHILECNG